MTGWRWVTRRMIERIHERQLADHGGAVGVRDENALGSALARPINLALYGDPDAADLAASLAFGIARNHPFADGNKRSAWVSARLFMRWNGIELKFGEAEATTMVQRLAAGELSEEEVATWLRDRIA